MNRKMVRTATALFLTCVATMQAQQARPSASPAKTRLSGPSAGDVGAVIGGILKQMPTREPSREPSRRPPDDRYSDRDEIDRLQRKVDVLSDEYQRARRARDVVGSNRRIDDGLMYVGRKLRTLRMDLRDMTPSEFHNQYLSAREELETVNQSLRDLRDRDRYGDRRRRDDYDY